MVRTGYVFDERYMWHDTGNLRSHWVEPTEHWENTATKRRLHNLLSVSGLLDSLIPIRPRKATKQEITTFHTEEYHDSILHKNGSGGEAGEYVPCGPEGYDVACLSAGGILAAINAVMNDQIDNAYCLVRPPGHHAVKDKGMGFCIFNNVAIGVHYARSLQDSKRGRVQRVAIVDYDVHHGNGTQDAFYKDPDCLFISLHQDNNYPQGTGSVEETGGEGAVGSNINIPLPPGSGSGAYRYAFDTVVIPALDRFKPDLILVSSGLDGSFQDPLASMMLCSEDYRYFATHLREAANRSCGGKIVFAHEGGYSKDYVPFCGLAVIEAISDIRTTVEDHYAAEAAQWGYQKLQPHQGAVIDYCAVTHGLKQAPNPSKIVNIKLAAHMHHLLQGLDSSEREELLKSLL